MRRVVLILAVLAMSAASALASSRVLVESEWVPENTTKTFLQFKADGVVSGVGGCNRFSGTYEVSEATLRFGPLASTRMACAETVMRGEQAFLEALSVTASYSLEADETELVLKSETGVELMRLLRSDP